MSGAIGTVAARKFSEEAKQLLTNATSYAKAKRVEVSAILGESIVESSVTMKRGLADLTISVKRPADLGSIEERFDAWGFDIQANKAGIPSACTLLRVRNQWRARNPETIRHAYAGRGGQARQYEPLSDDDGHVLVRNPENWLEKQIDAIFG